MLNRFTRLAVLAFAMSPALFSAAHAETPRISAAIQQLKPVAQANRVATHPDFTAQTKLTGHLPAWVSQGEQIASQTVDSSATLRVFLVLQRDPTVQAAFDKLLSDQQEPGSPLYHQWLTPQQVGQLYGPTDADVAAVTSWLTAQGLIVDQVANSHVIIDVHGSTAAVGNAFRTSFAYFDLNGEAHLSASSEPSVPTALASVIKSIHGLTDLPLRPLSYTSKPHVSTTASASATSLKPNLTTTSNGVTYHYLSPADFAAIYDVNSVYTGGNTGATIGSKTNHVAIIGRSRVAATDISEFATNTGIASYNLNTIIPTGGTDPGAVCTFANAATCSTSGDQGEQTLDVDRVIGTAPGVYADLIVATNASGGIYLDASYNVNTLLDPVMTISYGACEVSAGVNSVNLYDSVFSTGAAEGISTFVSSGDSAANGCASAFVATTKTYAASINYICASSYATCVGGTEFADTASPSTYWSSTNSATLESALSYIPEGAWNEPSGDCSTGTYCPDGTGGGASLYVARPTWQTGTGVPAGTTRLTPDMSYPASGHNGYYACLDYALGAYTSQGITTTDNCTKAGGGYYFTFSGTSAAAPAMAGVTALLNTKAGVAQGNLNPTLYRLAAGTSGSSVFHDVTVTSSGVSGCSITVPSMCNNSTPGSSSNSTAATGGLQGYLVTAGYDEATGLGSIDVANFLTAATAVSLTSTTTTLTVTPATIILGAATTLTATVSPSAAAGTVIFYSGSTAISTALTLTSGTVSFSYTPTATGTSSITAVYSGSTTYATSTSTATTLTVNASTAAATTTTLTLTPASVILGASSALKATVTSSSATGTVTFSAGATVIGSATLSGGTATYTYTPTAVGTYSITASYQGTTTYAASTSTASTLTVVAPFTLAAGTSTLNFTGGATSNNTDTITVTAASGFTGTTTLSCTITPVGSSPVYPATCGFPTATSTTVTGSGTATLTIASHTTTQQATRSGPQTAGSATTWGIGALLLALGGMFLPVGRRRSLRVLRLLPVFALFGIAAAMISGCGNGSNSITTPTNPIYSGSFGTYTATVTGTSGSYTAAPVSITVTINQ